MRVYRHGCWAGQHHLVVLTSAALNRPPTGVRARPPGRPPLMAVTGIPPAAYGPVQRRRRAPRGRLASCITASLAAVLHQGEEGARRAEGRRAGDAAGR